MKNLSLKIGNLTIEYCERISEFEIQIECQSSGDNVYKYISTEEAEQIVDFLQNQIKTWKN